MNKKDKMAVGFRISSYMGAHNLTQAKMAALIGNGVTPAQIGHCIRDGAVADAAVEIMKAWLNKSSVDQIVMPEVMDDKEPADLGDLIGVALNEMSDKKNPQGMVALEDDVKSIVAEIASRIDKSQKAVASQLIREAIAVRHNKGVL